MASKTTTNKKRRRIVEESEDEVVDYQDGVDSDEEEIVKAKSSNKSKKNKALIESDDENETPVVKKKRKPKAEKEEEPDNESTFSINDIKNQAKKRAKSISKAMDGDGEEEKTTKAAQPKKVTPAQKNNLFNYFKKAASGSPMNKPDQKDKSQGSIKEKAQICDDYVTTKIVHDDIIVIKQEKLQVKSPVKKVKEEKSAEVIKAPEEEKEIPIKKLKKEKAPSPVKVTKLSPEKVEEKKPEPKRCSINWDDDEFFQTTVLAPSKPEAVPAKEKVPEVRPASPEKVPSPKKVVVSPKKVVVSPKTVIASPKTPALPRIEEAKKISDLWVDKYKPKTLKSVIGMQGDKSPLNKLLNWLKNWHMNSDSKPAFSKFGGNSDGIGFKAALLSGPPGIGKTTSAHLVCKELGFDFLELNASDTRSKRSIKEDVKELLANTKLTNFFRKSAQDAQKLTARHCVVMDEVDGMAGNEDRGGVAELIQLIKSTKVPLICICNDRGNPKIRSLANHCFDIRVPPPRIENIRGPLKSIAFKEKINISSQVLDELIASSNYDIRQCIGNLSMLAAGHTAVADMINKTEKAIKDVKLGPFDAVRKVFSTGAEYAKMSFADKSDLFFADYGIMPLFVYENYSSIDVTTKESKLSKQLQRLARSIDAISMGDVVERNIRNNQNWSLLPLQATYSTMIPGAQMRSDSGLGFPQFPQYMGKISTTNKNHRLVDELVSHMTLSISANRTSFTLDYIEPLKNLLAKPLQSMGADAVPHVLDMLENYTLTRDNMSSLFELSLWGSEEDPLKNVDSKVKRALTTAYNKRDFSLPYASGDSEIKKIEKRGKGGKGKGRAAAFVSSKNEDASDGEQGDDEFAEEFY